MFIPGRTSSLPGKTKRIRKIKRRFECSKQRRSAGTVSLYMTLHRICLINLILIVTT